MLFFSPSPSEGSAEHQQNISREQPVLILLGFLKYRHLVAGNQVRKREKQQTDGLGGSAQAWNSAQPGGPAVRKDAVPLLRANVALFFKSFHVK